MSRSVFAFGLVLSFLTLWLVGCTAPVGADRVTTRQAYSQVGANALHSGRPSGDTVGILHRFNLDHVAVRHPDEAVRLLHQQALSTGDRDLLFALAELSYVAGDHIRGSVKPWDPRDARDYYLGSAVYAWLFLFGEGKEPPPGAFDRRFRVACDLYNYSLGLGLGAAKGQPGTIGSVQLESVRRRLPVGEIEVRLIQNELASQCNQAEQILLADRFRVRGLSVRNRTAGLGAPLMVVWPTDPTLGIHKTTAATVLLRLPGSLTGVAAPQSVATLELYSPFATGNVTIGETEFPLETDLTTFRAYTLNQSTVWKLGTLAFLAPAERGPSQLMFHQPYEAGRIPVVFVHGTFSSPVTWAEMINSLTADPVLRHRFQIWSFQYGSGNPLVQSVGELRAALTAEVQRHDPDGTNAALRQMVVIGHSQGGLLTKGTVVDTGDRIWRVFSTNRLDDLKISDAQRASLRSLMFYQPLPFVRRVVFIATPHRGSYRAGGLARRLAQRLVSLPGAVVSRGNVLGPVITGSEAGKFLRGRLPTSLDGMSPKNPGLRVLAELPVAANVTAHSIVAIDRGDQPPKGGDGVVKYVSAHVDHVKSEWIVRSYHTCLDEPATIQEVRRILHEHIKE